MFWSHQINNLTELEKAVIIDIANNIIESQNPKIDEFDIIYLRRDIIAQKLELAKTKIKEEFKQEAGEVIDGIKLKLNL